MSSYGNSNQPRPKAPEHAIPERESGPVRVDRSGRSTEGQRTQARAEGATQEESQPRGSQEGLETPSLDRVLHTVLGLSRQVSVEMQDDDIVHAYMTAIGELFPGRLVATRLVSSEDSSPRVAYANGGLQQDRCLRLQVSRDALERHGLPGNTLDQQGIPIVESYEPIFEEGAHGFDVPMMDRNQLMGILSVEYARGISEPSDDRAIIGQIALQLGTALHNARLLRESIYLRDYLGKLIDHANAPILVIGRHREIRVANQALLGLIGAEREELLGQDFMQLLPDSERSRLLPVFLNALRGRPTSNFELKLPRRTGDDDARISANIASIRNSQGEVEGVIAIGRDMTEVRELEEQVIHAEKLATLGQLAAGVVHELNNPLTSISAYGDYLLQKHENQGSDQGDVEKLRRIVQSAERVLRFTRDLVAYARPPAKEVELLSLHDELDQAVVLCEHVLSDKGAEVHKRYAESLPPVYGVKGQLHQVFINLITNASHAMPEGAGKLTLETEQLDGDRICIRLTDNGAGVPPDDLKRIFEPFFTTKGEGRGTGLGLSIVRNIVQQHNGTIDIDSTVGEGTSFTIIIPCHPQNGG